MKIFILTAARIENQNEKRTDCFSGGIQLRRRRRCEFDGRSCDGSIVGAGWGEKQAAAKRRAEGIENNYRKNREGGKADFRIPGGSVISDRESLKRIFNRIRSCRASNNDLVRFPVAGG
jgi:hypothetical protein